MTSRTAWKARRAAKWGELAAVPGAILPAAPKRRKRPAKGPAEAAIQEMVDQYLAYQPDLVVIRVEDWLWQVTMGSDLPAYAKKGWADTLKGMPDCLILHRSGRFLALEIKRADGKLSAAQRDVAAGIGTRVARSVDEAIAAIDDWKAKL